MCNVECEVWNVKCGVCHPEPFDKLRVNSVPTARSRYTKLVNLLT